METYIAHHHPQVSILWNFWPIYPFVWTSIRVVLNIIFFPLYIFTLIPQILWNIVPQSITWFLYLILTTIVLGGTGIVLLFTTGIGIFVVGPILGPIEAITLLFFYFQTFTLEFQLIVLTGVIVGAVIGVLDPTNANYS